MNNDLTELAQAFNLSERWPDSIGPRELASELLQLLDDVCSSLAEVKAKFVDIDTSFKEVAFEVTDHFQQIVAKFQNEELEADLIELHEALALYLIIKDRFGEAADWNLKIEFEGRLNPAVIRTKSKLKKFILP